MRINVGCGQTPTKGWRNFDNSLSLRLAKIPFLPELLHKARILEASQYQFIHFARSNGIEHGDVTKGLPLSDGSVDVLYSSHMLEHLDREEALLFLKEARRVLCSGGIIRLAVQTSTSMFSNISRQKMQTHLSRALSYVNHAPEPLFSGYASYLWAHAIIL